MVASVPWADQAEHLLGGPAADPPWCPHAIYRDHDLWPPKSWGY